MSEYGEPWRHDTFVITNASGEVVEDGDQNQFTLEELDRIVACVGALAGIPNPEAVREVLDAATNWAQTVSLLSTKRNVTEAQARLYTAVSVMVSSAPSTGAQQK